MAAAGIPIFVCRPRLDKPGKYWFPGSWQNTVADPAVLDQWQPGWGVGAVGGSTADFLDVDPRNGGEESRLLLKNEGAWPLTFGTQSTPSGGTHHVISATGERKETGFLPGIDFQAGGTEPDEEGSYGRAFVWLAPTVGRSKVTGELVPYRWVEEPDLEALDEWRAPDGTSSDTSTEGIIARVHAHRALRRSAATAAVEQTGSQLFASDQPAGSQLFGRGGAQPGQTRSFTMEQAKEFTAPALEALRTAQIGEIEERGMAATLVLEHFVPSHLSIEQAYALITDALSHTAYDPNGPSDWTADKFLARLDGRRPVIGSWKATLTTPWPEQAPAVATGRLRRAMLKRSEIGTLPDPIPLIDGVIYRNSVVVLAGKFGTYKSFIAVSWASSLATGTPWFGHPVPERVPVIYAAAEGAYGIKRRLEAWERGAGTSIPDDLYLIPISVRINRPEDVRELEELIVETGAKVLVFDTLHASTPGMDENDSGDMGQVYDVLRSLQERHGICAVLPHHTGHQGERARGSSSVEDDADTSFVVQLRGEERGPENQRTLVHRKAKDGPLLPPVPLKLELVELAPKVTSGYILPTDVWARDGVDVTEPGQEITIGHPADWTRELVPAFAVLQQQILQALADVAGISGRTEAQIRTLVAERWYGGKVGRKPGQLNQQAYGKAWVKVIERPEVVPGEVGSSTWILDPDWRNDHGL